MWTRQDMRTSAPFAFARFASAFYEQGIAAAAFAVNGIQREYERLKQRGLNSQ